MRDYQDHNSEVLLTIPICGEGTTKRKKEKMSWGTSLRRRTCSMESSYESQGRRGFQIIKDISIL